MQTIKEALQMSLSYAKRNTLRTLSLLTCILNLEFLLTFPACEIATVHLSKLHHRATMMIVLQRKDFWNKQLLSHTRTPDTNAPTVVGFLKNVTSEREGERERGSERASETGKPSGLGNQQTQLLGFIDTERKSSPCKISLSLLVI